MLKILNINAEKVILDTQAQKPKKQHNTQNGYVVIMTYLFKSLTGSLLNSCIHHVWWGYATSWLKLWGVPGMLFSTLTAVDSPSCLLGDLSRRKCCLLLPDLFQWVLEREPGLTERYILIVMPLEFMCNESGLSVMDIPRSQFHWQWLWFLLVLTTRVRFVTAASHSAMPSIQYNTIHENKWQYNKVAVVTW